jgi:flagellar biosynthesis GTPase FlhF
VNLFIISVAIASLMLFEAASAESSDTASIDPTTECITQIPLKKELQILNGKILLDGSVNYSFEMLANNNYPSKKEIKAIALWVNEHKRCKALGNEWRTSRYPAAPLALVDKLYSDNIFLAADLYAKKVTYGDFAKGVIKADQEFGVGIAALHEKLRQQQQAEQQKNDANEQQRQRESLARRQQSEQENRDALARQQQQEQAQQQQAALLQQQNLYRQQEYQRQVQESNRNYQNAIRQNPSSTTNCQMVGNQMNCNTNPSSQINWGLLNPNLPSQFGGMFQPH